MPDSRSICSFIVMGAILCLQSKEMITRLRLLKIRCTLLYYFICHESQLMNYQMEHQSYLLSFIFDTCHKWWQFQSCPVVLLTISTRTYSKLLVEYSQSLIQWDKFYFFLLPFLKQFGWIQSDGHDGNSQPNASRNTQVSQKIHQYQRGIRGNNEFVEWKVPTALWGYNWQTDILKWNEVVSGEFIVRMETEANPPPSQNSPRNRVLLILWFQL